jgi:hypothetical protein
MKRPISISITNVTEVIFWETFNRSATEEFSNILWNSKFHCRVQKSPRLAVSWVRWIHSTLHSYCLMCILILSSYLRLGHPNDLFPSGFHAENLYAVFLPTRVLSAIPAPSSITRSNYVSMQRYWVNYNFACFNFYFFLQDELNCKKHYPVLICSKFLHESSSDLLLSFSSMLHFLYFQKLS